MPHFEDDNQPRPGPERRTAEQWAPGEFLVASRDVNLVRKLLIDELSMSFAPFNSTQEPIIDANGFRRPLADDVEESKPLGLARFRLADPAKVLASIKSRVNSAPPDKRPGAAVLAALNNGLMPVTVLLEYIKDVSARLFNGWTPTLSKNVAIHGVHASPYISTGGAKKYPQPATSDDGFIPDPFPGPMFDEPNWVHVGILDTGLAARDAFEGRWLRTGPNPLQQPPAASATLRSHISGHATFIAGLILNMAPNALLHVARVLDDDDGSAGVWETAKAMMRLDKSVHVLNLSFSCFTEDGQVPMALKHAIERLSPTTVVVAAAGNHGEQPPSANADEVGPTATMWPAAMDRVIGVGSHDRHGKRSSFSPKVPWVQLTALGEDIPSTYPKERVRMRYVKGDTGPEMQDFTGAGAAIWSGTSFSSAVVAGMIARLTGGGSWAALEALEEVRGKAARGELSLLGMPLIKIAED